MPGAGSALDPISLLEEALFRRLSRVLPSVVYLAVRSGDPAPDPAVRAASLTLLGAVTRLLWTMVASRRSRILRGPRAPGPDHHPNRRVTGGNTSILGHTGHLMPLLELLAAGIPRFSTLGDGELGDAVARLAEAAWRRGLPYRLAVAVPHVLPHLLAQTVLACTRGTGPAAALALAAYQASPSAAADPGSTPIPTHPGGPVGTTAAAGGVGGGAPSGPHTAALATPAGGRGSVGPARAPRTVSGGVRRRTAAAPLLRRLVAVADLVYVQGMATASCVPLVELGLAAVCDVRVMRRRPAMTCFARWLQVPGLALATLLHLTIKSQFSARALHPCTQAWGRMYLYAWLNPVPAIAAAPAPAQDSAWLAHLAGSPESTSQPEPSQPPRLVLHSPAHAQLIETVCYRDLVLTALLTPYPVVRTQCLRLLSPVLALATGARPQLLALVLRLLRWAWPQGVHAANACVRQNAHTLYAALTGPLLAHHAVVRTLISSRSGREHDLDAGGIGEGAGNRDDDDDGGGGDGTDTGSEEGRGDADAVRGGRCRDAAVAAVAAVARAQTPVACVLAAWGSGLVDPDAKVRLTTVHWLARQLGASWAVLPAVGRTRVLRRLVQTAFRTGRPSPVLVRSACRVLRSVPAEAARTALFSGPDAPARAQMTWPPRPPGVWPGMQGVGAYARLLAHLADPARRCSGPAGTLSRGWLGAWLEELTASPDDSGLHALLARATAQPSAPSRLHLPDIAQAWERTTVLWPLFPRAMTLLADPAWLGSDPPVGRTAPNGLQGVLGAIALTALTQVPAQSGPGVAMLLHTAEQVMGPLEIRESALGAVRSAAQQAQARSRGGCAVAKGATDSGQLTALRAALTARVATAAPAAAVPRFLTAAPVPADRSVLAVAPAVVAEVFELHPQGPHALAAVVSAGAADSDPAVRLLAVLDARAGVPWDCAPADRARGALVARQAARAGEPGSTTTTTTIERLEDEVWAVAQAAWPLSTALVAAATTATRAAQSHTAAGPSAPGPTACTTARLLVAITRAIVPWLNGPAALSGGSTASASSRSGPVRVVETARALVGFLADLVAVPGAWARTRAPRHTGVGETALVLLVDLMLGLGWAWGSDTSATATPLSARALLWLNELLPCTTRALLAVLTLADEQPSRLGTTALGILVGRAAAWIRHGLASGVYAYVLSALSVARGLLAARCWDAPLPPQAASPAHAALLVTLALALAAFHDHFASHAAPLFLVRLAILARGPPAGCDKSAPARGLANALIRSPILIHRTIGHLALQTMNAQDS